MEKIFFQNDNEEFKCNILRISEHVIKLVFQSTYPSDIITNGFEIHNEHNNTNMSGNYYHSFNTVYKELDSCSVLLSDNGDVYVEPETTEQESTSQNIELTEQEKKEIEKQNTISQLQSEVLVYKTKLSEGDYVVIKCQEYILAGKELPNEYDLQTFTTERDILRNRINELESQISELENS